MSAAVAVATAEEVADAVREAPGRLLPVGGGTKPPLSTPPEDAGEDVVRLDVSGVRGIVEHDPEELTITARAGTPLREVREALAAHGQHLPCDPPLAGAGATLGGALAAGVSGPGAHGHGGLRDFVLGVRFVDGTGTLLRAGGRVVKNAAGFDVPKLLVGSAGRLGVLCELTCKVFPRPAASATLALRFDGLAPAVAAMLRIADAGMELVALDLEPAGRVLVRIADAPERLEPRLRRIAEAAGAAGDRLEGDDEAAAWDAVTELGIFGSATTVVRAALDVHRLEPLCTALPDDARVRVSLGGGAAWIGWPAGRPAAELGAVLHELGLSAVALRGAPEHRLLGRPRGEDPFARRIRGALDPDRRFLPA